MLVNESGMTFRSQGYIFYYTVPLVLRTTKRIIETITGY
jgi:hypothetical protein